MGLAVVSAAVQHRRRNGNARLTEDAVRTIRQDYATGRYTYAQLARRYGLHPTAIGLLIRGRRWGWVS